MSAFISSTGSRNIKKHLLSGIPLSRKVSDLPTLKSMRYCKGSSWWTHSVCKTKLQGWAVSIRSCSLSIRKIVIGFDSSLLHVTTCLINNYSLSLDMEKLYLCLHFFPEANDWSLEQNVDILNIPDANAS